MANSGMLFEGIPKRERHTTGTRSSSEPKHGLSGITSNHALHVYGAGDQ